jgi:cytoskeletal protein RodZ
MGGAGGELQDTKREDTTTQVPTMLDPRSLFMALILLEALLALLVLLFIVWWTMFSGRKKGELMSDQETQVQVQKKDSDA